MTEVKPDYGTSYDKGANPWIAWLGVIFIGYIGYLVYNRLWPEKKTQTIEHIYRTTYKGDSVLVLVTDSGVSLIQVPIPAFPLSKKTRE